MSEEIKKSVLVVDDNETNIMVLSTMLKRLGFDVDEATSGMEAIDHVCQKDYGLIFMDHLMPEMDGVAATKQILFLVKDENKPVVVGVSATTDRKFLHHLSWPEQRICWKSRSLWKSCRINCIL